MIRKAVNTIIFVLFTITCIGQTLPKKGVPHLDNYIPRQYQNKGKIWDIETCPNGLLYLASDKGLLEFDGVNWNSFEGSKGVTRSILVVNDSLLFSGSDLDFGVWRKNGLNNFEYFSLYPFKEEVQEEVEEFWNVFQIDGKIVFISSQNIYLYINDQVTQLKAPYRISSCFITNDTLFINNRDAGLYYFDKLDFKPFVEFQDDYSFIGQYKHQGESFLVSKNEGIFTVSGNALSKLKNTLSEQLKESKVFSFEQIGESYLAFGTILNGVIITDLEGNIIHQINKNKGLLSNTILSMHYSTSGKLWLGLDFGVSSLTLSDNITYFYDYRGDYGSGFVAGRDDDEFYLGTNQGLYNTSWSALDDDEEFTSFNLVSGTEGQVWSLLQHDNQLFIGHDHGLYSFENNQLTLINDQDGIWTIIPYNGLLLAGTYNGISIFNKSNGKWLFEKKMDLISGSCNQLVITKDEDLWVNIPNYGVINLEIDNLLNPLKQNIYLKDIFDGSHPYIHEHQDTVFVITDTRVYFHNPDKNEFLTSRKSFDYSRPDNILSGVYFSKPLSDNYAFFPIYNGFALKYLKQDNKYSVVDKPLIRKLVAYNNNTKVQIDSADRFPFRLNNIRVEFVLPNQDNVLFQYRLGKEDKWSTWTDKNSIDLVGLNAGDYDFQLRAKVENHMTDSAIISFVISNPRYLAWPAYLAYFILLLIIFYSLYLWRKQLLKKAKINMQLSEEKSIRELKEKHEETIHEIEQQRAKKEYEQIKEQLRIKTIELATKSKESEDKNRLLITMQEKFDEIKENPKIAKTRLSEIRRLLNSHIKVEDRTFEIQMDELHQEFFKNIKEEFPNLSNNDLRLCAYIRVGLNSKEIAEILNIKPSSSYISRSRLRKKLNLKTDDDLYDFLNKF